MSLLVRLPQNLYERDAFSALTTDGFSIGTARALCWLSQLAYEDENEKTDSILRTWGLLRLASFRRPVTSVLPLAVTRGFVAEGRGFVFVAFAGTDPLAAADWAIDLDHTHNVEGVHRGFAKATEAAWAQISETLAGLGSPPRKFLITGHSLGAALAALFAQRMTKTMGIVPEGIYTFGMPRIGSARFAHQFNQELGKRTYRLVHGDDIVARVPPSNLGYRHVGRPLLAQRNERFNAALLSIDPTDAPQFADKIFARLEGGLAELPQKSVRTDSRGDALGLLSQLLPPAIGDHLPSRYWRALRAR
jgi:hypothetical protein